MSEENKEWSRDLAALYCVNKQRMVEQDCNMECQSGKCLCMDHEQLFLLQCLMETEIIINIDSTGIVMGDEIVFVDEYCFKQCVSARKLINCHGHSVNNIVYKQTEKNVLGSLPIIQYVNMSDMVETRRTLACLCLFNGQGADILKAYMKAVIKRLCSEWPDRDNVKAVGKAADRLFEQIQFLYQEKNHKGALQKLAQNFEQFSNAYFAYSMHSLVEAIRESDCYLKEKTEHYTELPNALSWILSDEPDIVDGLSYLYYIVEKILKMSGSQIGEDMYGFFCWNLKKEPEHDTYEVVDKYVDGLLATEDKMERAEICRKIEDLFDDEL